jgi:hypothetical protein
VYGPGLTQIERIQEDGLPDNFINEIFMSRARTEIEENGESFEDGNFPGIKYVSSENNGWAYVYFKNEEKEIQATITLEFGGEVNAIRVLPPHSGSNPSFTIGPGEEDILLYKENGAMSTSVSIMTSFKKVAKVDSMKETVRESKIILYKKDEGVEIGVKVHFYKHKDGFAMLVINETDNLIFTEDLEFSLDNVHIEGVEGNEDHVFLNPGKEKLIKLVRTEEGPFEARLVRVMYTITQKRNIFSCSEWW